MKNTKSKKLKNKRKTKKGFTLVELLAVIVILAIVVGITLVTVLPTLKNARQEAFELSANIAGDYLEKQYQLSLLGNFAGESLEMDSIPTNPERPINITAENLVSAGLKPENYIKGTWYIDATTGRACVWLYASTTASEEAKIPNLKGFETFSENCKTKKDSCPCNGNECKAGEYYDVAQSEEETTRILINRYSSREVNPSIAKSSGCPE